MTFGVVRGKEPFLAELIALAFESAGYDCFVFDDVEHAARVLRAVHVESIVMDIDMPGRNGLEWLETMIGTWPDLPSRLVLLADTELKLDETNRIRQIGADFCSRPGSLLGVKLLVTGRVQRARGELAVAPRRGRDRAIAVAPPN